MVRMEKVKFRKINDKENKTKQNLNNNETYLIGDKICL